MNTLTLEVAEVNPTLDAERDAEDAAFATWLDANAGDLADESMGLEMVEAGYAW